MLFLQLINYFQNLNRILLSTFNINFKLPRLYVLLFIRTLWYSIHLLYIRLYLELVYEFFI